MNLNKLYARNLIKLGLGKVVESELKNGFILHTLRYRNSDGQECIGKFRERLEDIVAKKDE